MPRSLEFREIRQLPVTAQNIGGVNTYTMEMCFSYDSGGPPTDKVVRVISALGKNAEGITINRAAVDYLEVVSSRLGRLRRVVYALARDLDPISISSQGFAFNPHIAKEHIYPQPDN